MTLLLMYWTNLSTSPNSSSFKHVTNMLTIKIGSFRKIVLCIAVFQECHHQYTFKSTSYCNNALPEVWHFECSYLAGWMQLHLSKYNHLNWLTCKFLGFQKYNCGLTPIFEEELFIMIRPLLSHRSTSWSTVCLMTSSPTSLQLSSTLWMSTTTHHDSTPQSTTSPT